MAVVIGEPPHPQVLFAGFAEDDPGLLAMGALVPTARLLPKTGFDELREVEWDVLVANQADVIAPGHVHVLAFGSGWLGQARTKSGSSSVTYSGVQPSAQMAVPDGLPDGLRRLVVNELVPWLQRLDKRPYLTLGSPYGGASGLRPSPDASRWPFVLDADGQMIAGGFERPGGGWCWALPHVPGRPELWLAAALLDWHERTPDRVPALPGWRGRPAWTTRREAAALAALDALRDERERVLVEYAEKERQLEAEAAAALADAEKDERRLLTAQGADLVDAVAAALRTLGFDVEDADSTPGPPSAPKVEDLRVRDPDDPEWTNITEVRGYKAGAKASDLQRLGRFAALHAARTGALPASRWYVVNQFLDTDPDIRRPPLAGSEDDIVVFAEDGGLVVDTRELFRLRRLIDEGVVATSRARELLRRSTGSLGPEHLPVPSGPE